jgi:uncharacterized repeat protein (TIGR01451 family)
MNKILFKIGLGLLALGGLTGSSSGEVTGTKTLSGHVPAVVSQLAKTGELSATNELHLAIGLQLRNESELDDLTRRVSDPADPAFGHYLTVAQFTEQFAPSEADYQAVVDFARKQGLEVTRTSANRMLVEVKGKAPVVEKAFNVSLHTYQHPTENREFFAPDTEPTVPASLAIADIGGLSSYVRPHPMSHAISIMKSGVTPQKSAQRAGSNSGSGPSGLFWGYDFRSAYAPDTSLTGTGQNVALVQFDGYYASDIAEYEQSTGLPSVTLTNILLSGMTGGIYSSEGNDECSLDIEMVISMAPGISNLMVYEGNPDDFLPNVVLNQIAVDDAAPQISCSWGWTGGPNNTSDEIYREMIVQGQTFFNASGDSDALVTGEVENPDLNVFPLTDPYITLVGGVGLFTTARGSYASETVWNDRTVNVLHGGNWGSSGGISGYYKIPWWQTNVSMASNGGSTKFRNTPDVAMTASNICIFAEGGAELDMEGTSCASPLWAGFTALVNQQAANMGRVTVGFMNPAIYTLAASTNYDADFHDVTVGDNTWLSNTNFTWGPSTNEFYAGTNYDLCTGLGSPNGTNLINALTAHLASNNVVIIVTNTPVFPAPDQPWGTTLSVMNGSNPNGLYFLFYQDDTVNLKSGTNYNGWLLNLTTANPVGFAADNELLVDNTNITVTPGSEWVTTLAVTNYGPAWATNVSVADTLPSSSGVNLVSFSSSLASALVNVEGSTLIWDVGTLPVNTGGTLSLTFRGNVTGAYTNGATVSSANDPNPDDDSVGVLVTVAPKAPPTIVPHFYPAGNKAFALTISNADGSTVVIQASTNLVTWLPVATNIAPFTFTNFDNTNFPYRFYRAVIGQ